jgi:peptidoglycan/xylan/chitin deacetylase (PgdA/CDA1 family)
MAKIPNIVTRENYTDQQALTTNLVDTWNTFDSISVAPSAKEYGVGPLIIGGKQYWSDGLTLKEQGRDYSFARDESVTEKVLCDWSGNLDIGSWTTTGSTVFEILPQDFPVPAPCLANRGKFIGCVPAAGVGTVSLWSPVFSAVNLASAGTVVNIRVPIYFPDWRYNATTTGERIQIDLGTSGDYANRISCYIASVTSSADIFSGWNDFIIPICDTLPMSTLSNVATVAQSGTGTTSSIVAVRFQVKRYDINDTRPVIIGPITYGYKAKTKVCITFDDGQQNVFSNAYPALKKRGFAATFFTIGSQVSTGDGVTIISPGNLHVLQDNGWCIANHTWNHYNHVLGSETSEQRRVDILDQYNWLKNNGFNGYDIFAWPGGSVSHDSKAVLREIGTKLACSYTTATSGQAAFLPPVLQDGNRFNVSRWALEGNTAHVTTESLAALDFCIANGGHIIFNCHSVNSSATGTTNTNLTEFNTFLDGLLARVRLGQCEVVTVGELADSGSYE